MPYEAVREAFRLAAEEPSPLREVLRLQQAEKLEDAAYDLAALVMQSDAYRSDPEVRDAADKVINKVDIRAVLRRR